MRRNKAIISVTQAAILILIAAIAVTALGIIILKESNRAGTESKALTCLEMQQSPPLEIGKICFNVYTGYIEARMYDPNKRTHPISMGFNLDENGLTLRNWICGGQCTTCKIKNESDKQVYYLAAKDQSPLDKKLNIYVDDCLLAQRLIEECVYD